MQAAHAMATVHNSNRSGIREFAWKSEDNSEARTLRKVAKFAVQLIKQRTDHTGNEVPTRHGKGFHTFMAFLPPYIEHLCKDDPRIHVTSADVQLFKDEFKKESNANHWNFLIDLCKSVHIKDIMTCNYEAVLQYMLLEHKDRKDWETRVSELRKTFCKIGRAVDPAFSHKVTSEDINAINPVNV